jgi:hypothetical protein
MASAEEVSLLKVDQLKELAAQHNVEVADTDKKGDLVKKVSEAITPEDLAAYNEAHKEDSAEVESTEGNQDGESLPDSNKDAELKEATDKEDAKKEDAKEIETEGKSPEEAAAERAGVDKEHLNGGEHDKLQNRAPKNNFEQENQKVTDEARKSAQEVSDMTSKERVENSPKPSETAAKDAEQTASVNQGSDIAAAIRDGLKNAKGDNFKIEADPGVDHRFSLVKNKQGEVLLRENATGTLSKIQLESIEEREASIQGQEVEEI